ncbi:RNase A-like domain-containing protein [Streptomyces sp. NPDC059398]|uniref:RNase A-like domain-containing protein n=1 Tax=Streptomyces sp. NPDC059398 TaxID=3346820 RepID=UPI00369AECE6
MGFRGFDAGEVGKLAADLERASAGAGALHRSIGSILTDAQQALDPGQRATHNPDLQRVQETSAGSGVLVPTAPVPAFAGLPGSLGAELHLMSAEIKLRLRMFDDAKGPHSFGDGIISPVDAFNGITTRAKPDPKPEPKKRSWWKKWVADPLEDAGTDVATVMQAAFSPDSLTGIFESAVGIWLMSVGVGGEFGGAALDATGIGAVAGVPVNILSGAAIAGGGALTYKGFDDFIAAMSKGDYNAWNRASRRGPKPPQPREADPLKDEGYGGHGVTKHVGRSDKQMGDRLAKEEKIKSVSTFKNTGEAQRFSQRAIDANKQEISNWLKNEKSGVPKAFQVKDTGEVTGRSLSRADWQAGKGSREARGVRVILRPDPGAPGGYYILTTHPVA